MDGMDIALLVGAGYVALVALVRLMLERHRKVVARLRDAFERERGRAGERKGERPRDKAA